MTIRTMGNKIINLAHSRYSACRANYELCIDASYRLSAEASYKLYIEASYKLYTETKN